jgi:hypothetical protein
MKKYSLKDISIKQKLILIILSISVLALLLACLSFILFDQIRFKKKLSAIIAKLLFSLVLKWMLRKQYLP